MKYRDLQEQILGHSTEVNDEDLVLSKDTLYQPKDREQYEKILTLCAMTTVEKPEQEAKTSLMGVFAGKPLERTRPRTQEEILPQSTKIK